MGACRRIPPHEALLAHDLQQLEDRRVADRPGVVEGLVDIAYGARTALPQHAQNLELRVGRSALRHRVSLCTKLFVPTPGGFRRFPVGGGEWVLRGCHGGWKR